MQKHLLYINLFAITSALAFTACTDEVDNIITPDVPETGEKTPIELSVGGIQDMNSASTRAVVVTNGPGNKAFTNGTHIFMLMKSDYDALPTSYSVLDYKGSQYAKYATTRGIVKDGKVEFEDDNTSIRTRYWDDAHARSSKLSIWALACDDLTYLGGIGTKNLTESETIFNSKDCKQDWSTTAINATSLEWNVPNGTGSTQNADIIKSRDLLFSNNLANYSTGNTDAEKDKRLKFDPTTTPKHFEGGELVFYHALSKIVINLKMGEGFSGTNDFRFPAGKNVQLNHFNIWGKFSAEQGEFTEVNKPYNNDGHASIMSIYNKTGNIPNNTAGSPAYELEALVLPSSLHDTKATKGSRLISGNSDVMMEFTIDNNAYRITSDALFKAMHVGSNPSNALVTNAVKVTDTTDGTYIPLEAGKKYVFTFIVGKTKINNITAQVVDWEAVVAEEQTPSNARITLNVEERTEKITKALGDGDVFTLYRAEDNIGENDPINDNHEVYNWNGGYTSSVKPSFVAATGSVAAHWTTTWYWESNKHFYHFRTLCEAHGTENTTAVSGTLSSESPQYIKLSHAETNYKDICWGAPMLDVVNGNETDDYASLKWNYDPKEYGFDGLKKDVEADPAKHQIYKAIGPTEDAVKIVLFHMMSDVTFKVKTTTGTDKVLLEDTENNKVTNIELQKIYTEGNLYMGNGRVKGVLSGSATEKGDFKFTATPAPDASGVITWANYGAIPQDLENVVLVITTADNNQYKVKMADVLATSVTENNIVNPYKQESGKYKINAWYPGYKYEYSFTLKKKGIVDIEATIVDWEKVEAGKDDVQIE